MNIGWQGITCWMRRSQIIKSSSLQTKKKGPKNASFLLHSVRRFFFRFLGFPFLKTRGKPNPSRRRVRSDRMYMKHNPAREYCKTVHRAADVSTEEEEEVV
jgi:hypothetical protein